MDKSKAKSLPDCLGKIVEVVIDRPLGSRHPKFPNLVYEVNYGYIPGTKAADGEEIDAYVLGEDKALKTFVGRVIAIVERLDDNEDKLVVSAPGKDFTDDQIAKQINFQEKYFKSKITLCGRVGGEMV